MTQLVPPEHQLQVRELLDQVSKRARSGQYTIVLIGSFARAAQRPHSDIDFVVVSSRPISLYDVRSPLHVYTSTRTDFVRRVRTGDDFANWCVQFGIAVEGIDYWDSIKVRAGRAWPDWRSKLPHALRRLHAGRALLDLGDEEAGREELLYATGHTARALLLKEGIFPLSRAELGQQLRRAGQSTLANILEELDSTENGKALVSSMMYVKKVLIQLGPREYRELVKEKRAIERRRRDLWGLKDSAAVGRP